MAKFKLQPSPTFKSKVAIPIPGGRDEQIEFTFKRRDRQGIQDFAKGLEGKPFEDIVMECAAGWDLEEPFDAEHVKELVDNYIGSGEAVLDSYMREHVKAKEKN